MRNAGAIEMRDIAAHFAGDCAQAAEDKAGCPCADHSYHPCWAFNRTAIAVLCGCNAAPSGRIAAGMAEYHVCSDICVFVRLGKAYCLSLSGDWSGIAIAECPGAAEACLQRYVAYV